MLDDTPGSERERASLPRQSRDPSFELEVNQVNDCSERENDWEASSDFDGEDDPLFLSITTRKKRRSRYNPIYRNFLKENSDSTGENAPRVTMSTKDEWELECHREDNDFFTSQDEILCLTKEKIKHLRMKESE